MNTATINSQEISQIVCALRELSSRRQEQAVVADSGSEQRDAHQAESWQLALLSDRISSLEAPALLRAGSKESELANKLREIIADVEAMEVAGEDGDRLYGFFTTWEESSQGYAIEWANLTILIDQARELLNR